MRSGSSAASTGSNSGRDAKMKLDQLPGDVHLTYCTNIHAGERWPDIRASLDAHVPAIKAAVARIGVFIEGSGPVIREHISGASR